MRYAVVIEKADANYSAYVPDLPVPPPSSQVDYIEVAA